MAESYIGITEGAGKNQHTWQRTIDSIAVEDQFVLSAEPANPTYSVLATGIATTTSASHLIFIQADGTLYTRIKRIFIEQVAAAGAATLAQLQVIRTSTAGSGGGAITARGFDSVDAAYGGTIQTLPTVKGTEGVTLLQKRLYLTNSVTTPNSWEWLAHEEDARKPIVIGTSATDGICIKIVTGIASATVDISVDFTTDTSL